MKLLLRFWDGDTLQEKYRKFEWFTGIQLESEVPLGIGIALVEVWGGKISNGFHVKKFPIRTYIKMSCYTNKNSNI